MTDIEYLSPEELAAELGIPVGTIYNWNSRGVGPRRIRIGRHVRYRRSDVEVWVASHAHDSGTAA